MTDETPVLDDAQVEHFLDTGYVVVPGAFDPAAAATWVQRGWQRLGVDPDDPGTWDRPRVHLPSEDHVDAAEFAPRAFAAACQLLGGAERVELPWRWGDGFIANLGVGADEPFREPSAAVPGWHKDGDFFRHFLDSPEQGLLTIVLWTDVHSRGGGTFVATDSVGVVARFLAEHPEGVLPEQLQQTRLIERCREFTEITGRAGDVVLMHPYVLHATSQNVLRAQRLITNPPIALREPLRFDRADATEHSPVERAVLRGLGVERHAFTPTGPREAVVPERLRHLHAAEPAAR
ncbi:phytanoyl-CoA dioxygenase family protein [Paenibacillus sp. TRM 82003]|uniref:phytanoyl-CoA dioxygenase family protein n=1 Tax=Kineococcus sp. TRM81007 TaxID=2925831 RepID=UPI001F59774D|nr:phytanoyl-CoA dioxygenase family protein [Kineococcus sp. TRM81007]MCI2238129.1 phytanoyl-CoA dioxygenase family protein [Kineococcus sp. TRM81007]MCI3920513.1 phytanoyl-CoA dioxygenase family protein [Paenibacillus sp. TRM 82003]